MRAATLRKKRIVAVTQCTATIKGTDVERLQKVIENSVEVMKSVL